MTFCRVRSLSSRVTGILAIAISGIMLPDMATAAAAAKRFGSAQQCRAAGKLPATFCTKAFSDALRTYSQQVRRFPTREACLRNYATCVVYQSFPPRRLNPRALQYAPPFLGIAVTAGADRRVSALVGIERASLGVASGSNVPDSSKNGQQPEAINTLITGKARDNLFAEPLAGDVMTFPVPKSRIPKRVSDQKP
jgi:Protein of unknown function (DUF1190)